MSKDSEFRHVPVLCQKAIESLALRPSGTYVDCTVGGGGHSQVLLQSLNSQGVLLALDQDHKALAAARQRLSGVGPGRLLFKKTNFAALSEVLDEFGIPTVDGILADLGVSSHQLDEKDRGFSYRFDARLDMRMDLEQEASAFDIVNGWSQTQLQQILRDYGEERYAGRISRAIVQRRQEKNFERTLELADFVATVMPPASRREKQHPARRTFQAIRIAVNRELESLEQLLDVAPDLLADRGRIVIISFHSLEDRRVKQAFRHWENPCTCPRNFPVCVCGQKPLGRRIHRQGLTADPWELKSNPRAGSARLRCFERLRQKESDT